jgi:flagellar hook-length control protein FliK
VQWLVDQRVGEAHIKLNPPELGAVDVKVSLVDDKTYVQLTTATAAARDELAQSLPRLRELLTVSGLELGGASVHNGRDGREPGHHHGASVPERGAAFAELGDEPSRGVPRRVLGRIDIFA